MSDGLIQIPPAAQRELQLRAQAIILDRQRKGEWSGSVRAHEEYRHDPVGWLRDKLGMPESHIRWSQNPGYEKCYCLRCKEHGNEGKPHLWDGDVDPLAKALELIFAGKSVAVSSGTTTGKTYTLGAGGTLAFLGIIPNSVVFSIAPKQELLLKNMWKGVGELWPRFRQHFPRAQLLTGNLRMLDGEGQQELWTATAFGAGVGANEELAQRLKGFHHPAMLWIIEEMPGVVQPMIETIVKTATSEFNPILGLGNPEHQHDPLAQFGKREWVTPIRISGLDFPNVVLDREVIPGGRSRMSVLRDLADADNDPTHPYYLAQVRGIAPAQSKHALISWDWLEHAAKLYDDEKLRDGPLALGVDVADSPTGDKSAISRWQGAVCTEVESFSAEDASVVGRLVFQEIMNPNAMVDPKCVGIDSVGVGASAVNELKRLGVRVRLISGAQKVRAGVDVEGMWSETQTDDDGTIRPAGAVVVEAESYANTRSAVYWRLREDLRLRRIGLPRDPKLWEELTAIEYSKVTGRITVEPKEKIKERIQRSPDKADAVAYGNYVRRRRPVHTRVAQESLENTRNVDRGLERMIARREKQAKAEARQQQRALRRMARRRT